MAQAVSPLVFSQLAESCASMVTRVLAKHYPIIDPLVLRFLSSAAAHLETGLLRCLPRSADELAGMMSQLDAKMVNKTHLLSGCVDATSKYDKLRHKYVSASTSRLPGHDRWPWMTMPCHDVKRDDGWWGGAGLGVRIARDLTGWRRAAPAHRSATHLRLCDAH